MGVGGGRHGTNGRIISGAVAGLVSDGNYVSRGRIRNTGAIGVAGLGTLLNLRIGHCLQIDHRGKIAGTRIPESAYPRTADNITRVSRGGLRRKL